jgi:hypothetical protein
VFFFLSCSLYVFFSLFLLFCIQSFGERVRREREERGKRWRNNGGRQASRKGDLQRPEG